MAAEANALLSVAIRCAALVCAIGLIEPCVPLIIFHPGSNSGTFQRHDASCPICRQTLNNKTSLSRNYVVESVMDQQARILAIHNYPGWEPLGADILEWNERKT